ncbi:MAG TPA: hypothetical protein VK921_01250 [Anditalea sp.]|nr:hypothetical protein [Anditalea sp.]
MQDEILPHLNDPRQLEKIYRKNRIDFKKAFIQIYPAHRGQPLADFWNERLTYESDDINWGSTRDFVLIIILSLLAGAIAKLPAILPITEEYFYSRNIGFVVFPMLTGYFALKNKLDFNKILFLLLTYLAAVLYINLLPNNDSDTLVLACLHMILFLWAILGFSYVGDKKNLVDRRLGFLKYNGDLVVMSAVILLAGGLMTAVTIGLFSLIGFEIEKFYFEYIVIFCLPAVPIFATYITQTNPNLVGKISPVIAKIFSPIVLAMLIIYVSAMIYSGKDPYTDREFLIIFNALLVGVMAIIFFSLSEKSGSSKIQIRIILMLSIVTIVVNGIALSAILFRISEWGITPNRAAVLGSNILILVNLLLVTIQLIKVVTKKAEIYQIGKWLAFYLPVYLVWAFIVTFIFPLIFNFQ